MTRWRDPRAQLLDGMDWKRMKGPALTDLQLSEDPGELLAEQARALDAALRDVATLISHGAIDTLVDDDGRLHLPKPAAIPEPPVADRPAQASLGDAAAGRPARGDPGSDGVGAGVHRRVHGRVGWPDPAR